MPEDFNSKIISEFRENGGKVGGPFEGAPLLLLHTTGAKSGQERVNPMMYQAIGTGLQCSPRRQARRRTRTGTTTLSRTRA